MLAWKQLADTARSGFCKTPAELWVSNIERGPGEGELWTVCKVLQQFHKTVIIPDFYAM